MDRLLVIGGLSSDVLHLADRTVECAGGAGMYTAAAARRSGIEVDLFGPRPEPWPESMKPVAEHLTGWLGPAVSPSQLPQFEISYQRGTTDYLSTSFGAEELLSPDMLPADLSAYDLVHVTPLCDAQRQLSFVQACRQRGANKISAGTGLFIVAEKPQVVRAVMEQADYFFPELPPVSHPKTLDFFFAATLQQFSFWTVQRNRYGQPLIARISGVEQKGSDYLWEAFRRQVERDADFCSPHRQANLSHDELLEVFRADNGEDPMPALDLHLEQANQYGRDMVTLQLTPRAALQNALTSDQPLQTFLVTLDQIGGYKEDPLRKKSNLLAMILNQRPEIFLPLRTGEQVAPIIDYHLMRSCLRVGLVEVMDEELNNRLRNRLTVQPADEWAVRYSAYRAIEQVSMLSGKTVGAIDSFFFGARKRCPEMGEPECQLCQLDRVCAHRIEMFQPVLRTSFY
jgi:hypothetical protein